MKKAIRFLLLSAWTAALPATAGPGQPGLDRLVTETGVVPVVLERPGADLPALVRGFTWGTTGRDPVLNASDFVSAFGDLLGIVDPAQDLVMLPPVALAPGTVVKFAQSHGGVPVFGRGVILRISAEGLVTYAASNALPVAPGLGTRPLLPLQEAEAIAAASITSGFADEARARLTVLAGSASTLAWAVPVTTRDPVGSWLVFVDALTGQLAGRLDRLFRATGKIYTQNPVSGELLTVELPGLTGDGTTLSGSFATTYRFMGDRADPVQTALADAEGNFLFDPAPGSGPPVFDDPFCEVNVYYHADAASRHFADTYGYVPARAPLTVLANVFEGSDVSSVAPFDNGYFDAEGWLIALGQGTTVDFGYDASTVYHEFVHSVVATVADLPAFAADDLGVVLMPGAINEGLADYFGGSLTDDPNLEEYIPGGRNLLTMKKCPESMTGESHQDGMIIAGSLWKIREAIGAEAADGLAYAALNLIPQDVTLAVFAQAFLEGADAMIEAGTLTEEAKARAESLFAERGVTLCDRIIPVASGETVRTGLIGLDILQACDGLGLADAMGWSVPSAFQWAIEVPPEATTLTVDLTLATLSPADEKHWVHVRGGEPVRFEMLGIMGWNLPLKVRLADGTFPQTEGFELTAESDPPLMPGSTTYIAVSYLACPSAVYQIRATTDVVPVPEPGADGSPDAAQEDDAPPGEQADASNDPASPDAGEAPEEDGGAGDGGCACSLPA